MDHDQWEIGKPPVVESGPLFTGLHMRPLPWHRRFREWLRYKITGKPRFVWHEDIVWRKHDHE